MQSSHSTGSHTNVDIKQENTIIYTPLRYWPQVGRQRGQRGEDELVDCIMVVEVEEVEVLEVDCHLA